MYLFFFQAEDGIRDRDVTGVQTCALPIYRLLLLVLSGFLAACATGPGPVETGAKDTSKSFSTVVIDAGHGGKDNGEIGRASCRERMYVANDHLDFQRIESDRVCIIIS